MKAAALRSFLIMLFLVATPAMAEQKLFFHVQMVGIRRLMRLFRIQT